MCWLMAAPPSVVVSELWREDLSWLAVQSDSWKVLIDRNTERIVGWWDLSEDPGEAVNLVDADTALGPDVLEGVYAMRDDVDRLASLHAGAGAEGTGSLPAGVEESLRSLGYIGENE